MVDFNTPGIVLRYTNVNESDRMLTVFSPDRGRLSVLARGCRKPGSKFLSAAQLFSYCSFTLRPYRDINILVQSDIYNNFYNISQDMQRLANASYILNLTDEVVHAGEGNRDIFSLLLNVLTYLTYIDINPEHITYMYELKFISLIGYQPELYNCINCGSKDMDGMIFFLDEGGLYCKACVQSTRDRSHSRSFPISPGTICTMRHMLEMDISGIKVLKFYSEIKKQLNIILSEYIFCKLDKKIKSREFINPAVYDRRP